MNISMMGPAYALLLCGYAVHRAGIVVVVAADAVVAGLVRAVLDARAGAVVAGGLVAGGFVAGSLVVDCGVVTGDGFVAGGGVVRGALVAGVVVAPQSAWSVTSPLPSLGRKVRLFVLRTQPRDLLRRKYEHTLLVGLKPAATA